MRKAAPLGAAPTLKHHFARRLASRFALRMHVALIVLWSLAWGVACNKLLRMAGLDAPPVRYGVATVAAWLAMLAAFKLWLAYAGFTQQRQVPREHSEWAADTADAAVDLAFDLPLPSGGGGGAETVAEGLASADEFLPLAIVIAVVVAVMAASLGVLTYFYTQGPMLLSEAAFEVLLAGGLIRSARRANDADWLRTVVVRTAVPWLIVLGCAIAIGLLLR
jgi:hypothetical protein